MAEPDDHQLLREFVRDRSEAAFGSLVRRHLNWVHSTALRQVSDAHAAEEITQAVFVLLARKGASIRPKVVISGWLYQTTRWLAANHRRSEARRLRREQEAFMEAQTKQDNTAQDDPWSRIVPFLDDALAELGERDRNAIVLRFFEDRTLGEIGGALGVSEDAARMRVGRALDKLRHILGRRGVTVSSTLLAGAVAGNSVQAAPAHLLSAATQAAVHGVAGGSAIAALVDGFLQGWHWTKAKLALAVAIGLGVPTMTAVVGFTLWSQSDPSARQIIDRVSKTYVAMTSYSSAGTTTEEISGKTLSGTFSLRFGRTNLYRLDYVFRSPNFTNQGVAWSSGSGDYFSNAVTRVANRIPAPVGPANLDDLWDVSGGATLVVPSLFFGMPLPPSPADSRWRRVLRAVVPTGPEFSREKDASVGEKACYVVSSESNGLRTILWVGKEDFLVHRSQRVQKDLFAEATDAEVQSLLASLNGVAVSSQELRRSLNRARREAAKTMKPATVVLSGRSGVAGFKSITVDPPAVTTWTQTHERIRVDQPLRAADFAPE